MPLALPSFPRGRTHVACPRPGSAGVGVCLGQSGLAFACLGLGMVVPGTLPSTAARRGVPASRL